MAKVWHSAGGDINSSIWVFDLTVANLVTFWCGLRSAGSQTNVQFFLIGRALCDSDPGCMSAGEGSPKVQIAQRASEQLCPSLGGLGPSPQSNGIHGRHVFGVGSVYFDGIRRRSSWVCYSASSQRKIFQPRMAPIWRGFKDAGPIHRDPCPDCGIGRNADEKWFRNRFLLQSPVATAYNGTCSR